jgi:hypothetical protein
MPRRSPTVPLPRGSNASENIKDQSSGLTKRDHYWCIMPLLHKKPVELIRSEAVPAAPAASSVDADDAPAGPWRVRFTGEIFPDYEYASKLISTIFPRATRPKIKNSTFLHD